MFVADCFCEAKIVNDELVRKFRIFFTTKRLLGFIKYNKLILSDATYKIIVEGYPVLTVGTTDYCRTFHPFGYAIVCSETHEDFSFYFLAIKNAAKNAFNYEYEPNRLCADNAEAIHNGFNEGNNS